MKQEELIKMLEKHNKWLQDNSEGERADLRWADLQEANLQEANLRWADLQEANLSHSKGIQTSKQFLSNFSTNDKGIIVYKTFGYNYIVPNTWNVSPLSFIEEVVNPDRGTQCGCGINFGTIEWIKENQGEHVEIWKCLIHWEDLADVVVPFNTDGKARCARLQLLEVIK